MWHPRDHLGIPHLHSTTKRWFLRFGAAPKIAVLHCWSSVYSTLLWGESPFTIVLIVIIPLYPHHSIILSAYLLYQTMVYVILSSLSQRESSQYANNLIWTPRFFMAIYINLAMALHRTWDMLGYVGICWDMLGCGSAVGWIPHRTWWTSSQVIPGPSLLLLWLWLLWGFLRGPKNATEESGQCGCCLVGFTTAKGLGILLAVYD